jgi:SAM-dependent methyltransferase
VNAPLPLIQRNCPACGGADSRPNRYSVAPWDMVDCSACGLAYLRTVPDYAAQFAALAWERTTKLEEVRRQETRPVSYRVSKATRRRLHLLPRRRIEDQLARHAAPGNVVDLGCGTGDHLTGLPPGYVPHGVEISTALAEQAQAKLLPIGGQVANASSLDGLRGFADGFFTGAMLRSYLEHESRPAEVLGELHRTLAPGGVAIVKVPNYASWNRHVMGARWCGFRWPDHMNHFTPRTLTALAARTGYGIRFGLTGRLPTSDNMWAVLRKR